MKKDLRPLVFTAVGIALFTVLALCLQVPVFQNYYLCLGYVAMAVCCCSLGALSGILVGSLGVVAYCLLTSGLRGMPGWALGNAAIGLVLGWAFSLTRGVNNRAVRYAVLSAAVLLGTAAGILGIKSLVDSVIRSQPFAVRAAMNLYAFVADAAVLLLSLPVCGILDPRIRKLMGKEP